MVMEIQCYDGDGVEPPHITREREAIERRYQQRRKTVGERLAKREQRAATVKLRAKCKPVVGCERFEMRQSGNRAHFHIKSLNDPRSLVFFAGDIFKEMTIRYPARNDIRDPMRMPVVFRAIKPKVIQMHAVEPLIAEEDRREFDRPMFWEISLTIEFEELINDSQKDYKKFRKAIVFDQTATQQQKNERFHKALAKSIREDTSYAARSL